MNELVSKVFAGTQFALTSQESFNLSQYCSTLLNSMDEQKMEIARRIVIHILDNWDRISSDTYPIWADMLDAAGFYPYLSRNQECYNSLSFSDAVRTNSYYSRYLPVTLHQEQKKVSDWLFSGKNVVVSAPTSFGKSLLIEELVASRKYKNIVIIQPTLALLDETRLKLRSYSDYYKIIVRTSQETSAEKGNLFLLTAERVMEYSPLPRIDLLIIDEFYKLSLRRIDERATTLNNAFLKIVKSNNTKFYLLGPNIDGITPGFKEEYNAIFYRTDFSLVDCNVIDKSQQFDYTLSSKKLDKQRLSALFELLDQLREEQTLIYCSSPARARRFAKEYTEHLHESGVLQDCSFSLVEWIANNISPEWSLSDALSYGIAFHDGSLQKHIANSIIEYFNAGRLRCIFCTSTIIEGVNTSAKNVVLFDGKKANKSIDYFDYSNIKGRSGRLMEHYIGNVYNFVPVPPKKEIIVDIPFFEQDEKLLNDEILINIPDESVQPQVRERYDELYMIPHELVDIIKINGVSVNGQMNIYYALERDILHKHSLFSWTQVPKWNALEYVLSLAEHNLFDFSDRHGVVSVRQLVHYLDTYRRNKSILAIVNEIYQQKATKAKTLSNTRKHQYINDAIETAFHIYRHWFQFAVPKALRVVDSIQRYVCAKHRKKAGAYSYYVQQLENDFVPERLSILLEYGIPSSTILKIQSFIPDSLDEDEIVNYIKLHAEQLFQPLLQYEIERLKHGL